MKLLDLDRNDRDYYTSINALYTDKDGQETLIGLTPAESVIYLEVVHKRFDETLEKDTVYLELFLDIYSRHHAAAPTRITTVELLKQMNIAKKN